MLWSLSCSSVFTLVFLFLDRMERPLAEIKLSVEANEIVLSGEALALNSSSVQ